MSFGGPAASTSGWCTGPGERGTGSIGCAGRARGSLLTGLYAMATAGHREPCDSRGSCTVLGAPGGESPPGDSPFDLTASFVDGILDFYPYRASEFEFPPKWHHQ